jgi:hypothetical protein
VKLTITAALTRARRRNIAEKAAGIQAVLRAEQLGQPEVLTASLRGHDPRCRGGAAKPQ